MSSLVSEESFSSLLNCSTRQASQSGSLSMEAQPRKAPHIKPLTVWVMKTERGPVLLEKWRARI